MHVPEAGENGLALRVDDIRVPGNLHFRTRTNCNDASVVDDDRGIRDWGHAGAVDQGSANDGQGGGAAAGDAFRNFGERAHAVGSGASDEITERTFVAVTDGFEVVKLGIGGDGGD